MILRSCSFDTIKNKNTDCCHFIIYVILYDAKRRMFFCRNRSINNEKINSFVLKCVCACVVKNTIQIRISIYDYESQCSYPSGTLFSECFTCFFFILSVYIYLYSTAWPIFLSLLYVHRFSIHILQSAPINPSTDFKHSNLEEIVQWLVYRKIPFKFELFPMINF